MHKIYALFIATCLLAGCSQFSTSKQESAALEAAATAQADAYVGCVTQNGLSYTGQSSGEISTVMQVATTACQPALDSYRSAQDEYLKTQIMLTDKALTESIEALNQNGNSPATAQQTCTTRPARCCNCSSSDSACPGYTSGKYCGNYRLDTARPYLPRLHGRAFQKIQRPE